MWFVIVFIHFTEQNGLYATSNNASNAMIDYSMVKCKLMEPRTGTGYTFSEWSEFHGTRKHTKNNNKPRLGEQGSLKFNIDSKSWQQSDKSILSCFLLKNVDVNKF